MPLRRGRDSKGSYYQWGNSRKKYYYGSESSRKKAKQHAIIQGYAIEKSQSRRGKPNTLGKSKSTGRKTHLKGISSRGRPRASGSRGSKSSRGSKRNSRSSINSRSRTSSKSKSRRISGSKTSRRR